MTGDHQAQLVQVQDIIQNGQCTGPVAEPVVWVTPHRVAVVFVCRQCAARHTLEGLPSSVVHLIQRAEDGRRVNAHPTAQLRAAALLDTRAARPGRLAIPLAPPDDHRTWHRAREPGATGRGRGDHRPADRRTAVDRRRPRPGERRHGAVKVEAMGHPAGADP